MARGLTDAGAAPAIPGGAPEPATAASDDGSGDGGASRTGGGWRDRLARLVGPAGSDSAAGLAVTLLPFAVGIVVLVLVVGGDYRPVHDLAQIELRIRDVGHHEIQLGPYSRDGWYHPGPAMFYLLALPYRLLGSASVGMNVGGLLVNGAAVAGMAVVARRRGGTPLFLITLLACGLLVRSLGPDFVRDPWNPSLPVLAFGLVLFLSWAMTCGEVWALPVATAVASFVVQTHIGYLALAVPLVAWGAAWLVVLAVRQPEVVERGRLVRSGLVTAGVATAMWALPVVQQLTGEPGNLGEALRYFRTTDEPGHTLGDAWRVLATQFTLTPEWITGNEPVTLSGEPTALYRAAPVPLLLVPLVAAVVVLWRRGGSDARRLVLTLGLALGLGMLAVVNTTGLAFTYRLRWVEVLAMTAGVLVLWAAWLWLDARLPRPLGAGEPGVEAPMPSSGPRARIGDVRRRLGAAAAAAIVVLAALNTASQVRAGTPQEHDSAAVAELVPEVEAALPPGEGPVLIRPTSFGSMLFVPALLLGLERDGVPGRVDPISAAMGEHRLYRGEPLRAELVIAVDEEITPRLDDPSLELLAQWGTPREPDPDDVVTAFEQAFPTGDMDRLEDLARATLDDLDELEAPYTIRAVAVFSVKPGQAPAPPPADPAANAPAA